MTTDTKRLRYFGNVIVGDTRFSQILNHIDALEARVAELERDLTCTKLRENNAIGEASVWQRAHSQAIVRAEASERQRDEAVSLVDRAIEIITRCEVSEGVCCCGDVMDNHPEPMACGHSPVDHGQYVAAQWLKEALAAMQPAKEKT